MAEGHRTKGWEEHIVGGRNGCTYHVGAHCCGKIVDKGQKWCPYHIALDAHLVATRCKCDCHLAPPSDWLCTACGCPCGNHEVARETELAPKGDAR